MEIRQFKTRQQGTMNFSVVGLGTAPIGDLYAKLDEKTAISTVEQALACGVTLFDTSPHYGNGLAEVRLGSGLRHAGRNGLLVSSKIGRTMDPMGAPASLKTDVVSPGFAGGLPMRPALTIPMTGRCVQSSNLCCEPGSTGLTWC